MGDDERIAVPRRADDIDGAGSQHEKRNHAIAVGKEHISLADGPRGPVVRNPLDLRRRQRREHEPHAFGGDGRRERSDETHASVYRQPTGERHAGDVLTVPQAVRATITLPASAGVLVGIDRVAYLLRRAGPSSGREGRHLAPVETAGEKRLLLLLTAIGFAILFAVSWQKWADLAIDGGREMNTPVRLLHGEMLYADVYYL